MIDIHSEEILPLNKALNAWVPTRPHLSTGWRWAHRGVRGHKLETIRIGGVTCTSRQAIERFLSALNGRDVTPVTTSRTRESEIARAERELAAAGVR